MTTVDAVELGRALFRQQAWGEAHARLAAADRASELDPEDLERLACAAHLLGRSEESAELWVRAHREYERRGAPARAARCAYWLALPLLLNGELARGGGWLSRGQRLLADAGGECVEQGYLLLPAGIRAFLQNDAAAAHAAFEEAARIGERYGDRELTTLARQGQGRALIRLGQTARGVGLLDEVMVAVTAGEVSPIVVGDIYCSVHRCLPGGLRPPAGAGVDRRARPLVRRRRPTCSPYRGHCLVHRAEILQLARRLGRRAGGGAARRAIAWAVRRSPRRRRGLLPAGRAAPAARRVRRRRGEHTGRPAAAAASRSRAWRCCGWRRARSTPRAPRSAAGARRDARPPARPGILAAARGDHRSPPATSRRRAPPPTSCRAIAARARARR